MHNSPLQYREQRKNLMMKDEPVDDMVDCSQPTFKTFYAARKTRLDEFLRQERDQLTEIYSKKSVPTGSSIVQKLRKRVMMPSGETLSSLSTSPQQKLKSRSLSPYAPRNTKTSTTLTPIPTPNLASYARRDSDTLQDSTSYLKIQEEEANQRTMGKNRSERSLFHSSSNARPLDATPVSTKKRSVSIGFGHLFNALEQHSLLTDERKEITRKPLSPSIVVGHAFTASEQACLPTHEDTRPIHQQRNSSTDLMHETTESAHAEVESERKKDHMPIASKIFRRLSMGPCPSPALSSNEKEDEIEAYYADCFNRSPHYTLENNMPTEPEGNHMQEKSAPISRRIIRRLTVSHAH